MLIENQIEQGDSFKERTAREIMQGTLFELDPSWREHWWGMPAFDQNDCRPVQKIVVNFISFDDARRFADRLGIAITKSTDSLWYPPLDLDAPSDWEWSDES